jgi:hypothetical protein
MNAALDQSYQVGPVLIRPGDRRLIEFIRGEPRSLVGVTRVETRPIIIEGNWPGNLIERDERYRELKVLGGERANERLANSWIYRSATLLALVFDGEPWQVRNAATSTSRYAAAVPNNWPEPPNSPIGFGGGVELVERSLPPTISSAWTRLDEDVNLSRALTSWHQGRLLATLFPSYAHVAYCASIETIARTSRLRQYVNEVHVDNSQTGTHPSASSTFWATVSLVRGSNDVADLKSAYNPYGARSGTAHGSVTHGIEDSFGYEHMMMYVPPQEGEPGGFYPDVKDSTQEFMWQALPEMEKIARELLTRSLFDRD